MLTNFFENVINHSPVTQGLAGGIVIALLNMMGALVVLVWRKPSTS